MLVLSRRMGESLVLPGLQVVIKVVRISGNRVKLGVSAPASVAIHRDENVAPDFTFNKRRTPK